MKNREIKFRGYTSGNFGHHWCYGYLFRHPSGIPSIFTPNEGSLCVNEESIGQFTGLKDKNGVEIYEGDIVKVDYNFYRYPTNQIDSPTLLLCRFTNGGFNFFYKHIEMVVHVDTTVYEVIGNIYEHPHLLTPQS